MKEAAADLADSLLHPIDTVVDAAVGIWEIANDPKGAYEQVVISYNDWEELLAFAMENDPKAAGEMLGLVGGKLEFEAGLMALTSGGEAAISSSGKLGQLLQKLASDKKSSGGSTSSSSTSNSGKGSGNSNQSNGGSGKSEQTSDNKPNLNKGNIQNSDFDDLAKLYNDKNINVTDFEIKIDGKTHRPDLSKTNPNGGAPIYSGLSDKEVKDYFATLAGGAENVKVSPKNSDISFAKLPDGTSLTLRPVTSSTGKWTIDIRNNPKMNNNVEIKFD